MYGTDLEVTSKDIQKALEEVNASDIDEQTKQVLNSVWVILMNKDIELEKEKEKNKWLVKSLINTNSLPKNNTVCTMTVENWKIDIPFIGDPLTNAWITKHVIKWEIEKQIWIEEFLYILEERKNNVEIRPSIEPTSKCLVLWKETYIVCISVSKDRSENIFSNSLSEESFIENQIQEFMWKKEKSFIYWVYFLRLDLLDKFFREFSYGFVR